MRSLYFTSTFIFSSSWSLSYSCSCSTSFSLVSCAKRSFWVLILSLHWWSKFSWCFTRWVSVSIVLSAFSLPTMNSKKIMLGFHLTFHRYRNLDVCTELPLLLYMGTLPIVPATYGFKVVLLFNICSIFKVTWLQYSCSIS